MFPVMTMGGISGILQGMGKTGLLQGANKLMSSPSPMQFSMMDALGSAAARSSGGSGRNPHLDINPMYGLQQYRDMSQPNMNGMLSLMSVIHPQQANPPMQVAMHPMLQQMLRLSGAL